MTDQLRKAAEMALEALEKGTTGLAIRAIPALRTALAQPEQEPVVRFNWNEAKFEWLTEYSYEKHHMKPLYLAPPSKPWVSLTDEEIDYIYKQNHNQYGEDITGEYERELEAKLKEKNT